MNKKLTAKTQQLDPVVQPRSDASARSIIIAPDTPEIASKKGTIYGVYNLAGDFPFDTVLIHTLINDILHNSYFQSENISPVQTLEKAILEVRDKIVQITNDNLRQDVKPIKFDVITGALWGNVMYIVQYGECEAHLMREGVIKPIGMVSEGNFSAASGVLRNDDVIIFCTKEFGREHPPQKLLTSMVSGQELNVQESSVIVKIIVDAAFSKDEVVRFEENPKPSGAPSPSKVKDFLSEVGAKLGPESWKKGTTGIFGWLKTLRKPSNTVPSPKGPAEYADFKDVRTDKLPLPEQTYSYSEKIREAAKVEKTKPALEMLVNNKKTFALGGMVLVAIIGVTLLVTQLKAKKEITAPQVQSIEEEKPIVIAEEIPETPKIDKEADLKNKVIRVADSAIYDLKITDTTAEPTSIVAFKNSLLVIDNSSDKLYMSPKVSPKFEALTETFKNVKNPTNFDEVLAFSDSTGYKFFDVTTKKTTGTYDKLNMGLSSPYSDYIYELQGDKIIKNTKAGSTLEGATWGTSELFTGAKSIVTAFNIFIATKTDTVEKYLSGSKTTFKVTMPDTPFKDIAKLETTVDFDNLYVADRGNKRIVVIDKETGALVKQFKSETETAWEDLRGMSVDQTENELYILAGSKVYKIDNKLVPETPAAATETPKPVVTQPIENGTNTPEPTPQAAPLN